MTASRSSSRLLAALLAWGAVGGAAPAPADAQAVPDEGVVGAALLLRQLDGVGRVLVIGAHPDDEDTSLLAALDRGAGVRAAYLSLTRGEGGQNLIGSELGEGLGIVRSGELLSARELDGAEQFFTRAYDFGYSRSAEETFGYWPRDELLDDVVRVVRRFRPHVIVSVFSGTPSDGHGQHQVAGIMAREAFDAAADPDRYPGHVAEGLEPWTPLKLYRLAWWDPEEADTEVETGSWDPVLGRSHYQLAMESRSRHRSQDMGAPRPLGSRISSLELVRSRVEGGGGGIFAGIDTTLAGLARSLGDARSARLDEVLDAYRGAVAEARERLGTLDPAAAAVPLAAAVRHAREALAVARWEHYASPPSPAAGRTAEESALVQALERREALAAEALLRAGSVVLDVRAVDGLLVPGQETALEVELWNAGPMTLEDVRVRSLLPEGWDGAVVEASGGGGGGRSRQRPGTVIAAGADPIRLGPGELGRWRFVVGVPPRAEPSTLYYLEEERRGEMYAWPDEPELLGLPRDPVPIGAAAAFELHPPGGDGVRVTVSRPAAHPTVDKALGEMRVRPLVAPRLSVTPGPEWLAWPLGRADERTVTVEVRNASADPAEGRVRLLVPAGWGVEPAAADFRADGSGGAASVSFRVSPPAGAGPGEHTLEAVAEDAEGNRYDRSWRIIDHPHIERAPLSEPARVRVALFPVEIASGLRVGYVMGSGDDGARALRQLGAEVDPLDAAAVRGGELGGYDAIVLGVRAYETRPDLVEANERFLEYARRGGTLVVQYNKYEFPRGGFAPYPLDVHRPHDRVTDEGAPVTLLRPDAPVFTRPNRITAADFEGWVQERGLYFLGEWDPRYVPLLEMADPGRPPTRGSLVAARLGEGLYVYTGLAFFRQLPELVPGAYRLLANLVSLGALEGGVDPAAW